MKEIWFCLPDGDVRKLWLTLGQHISTVAHLHPTANIYWMNAPIEARKEDAQIIRYVPN